MQIQHVSDTAFLVAQCRALESERNDALFHDPLAAVLAGEKGRAIIAAYPTAAMTGWTVALRTVIIDELIQSALARGVVRVINLGAGLDTRPYRLELPQHLEWIEVDYPDMLGFKAERLAGQRPLFPVRRVPLDLADLAARQGFFRELGERERKTLVLTEGVVPYLGVEQAASLAADLRALPSIDSWIVDYFSKDVHAYRDRQHGQLLKDAPFLFRPEDWFGFFASHGWGAREIRYLAEEGARLRRPPPLPRRVRWVMKMLWPFVPASRRDAFRRATAYVVLEPQ